MIDYEYVLKKFKKYVEKFDTFDQKIAMTISHSYHVADLAGKLAKRLELDVVEIALVKVIGLLHDIGRFVQYEKPKTYSDNKSKMDHAEIAISYLFDENHIEDFKIPEEYHKIINKAIFNHNKLAIEENLTEKELYFAKFLRDVDKIDIFRQEATSLDLVFNETITEKVRKDFYKHHLVNNRNIQNLSDFIVCEIAYVFDINFKESFELLIDTDNLELFLSVIQIEKEMESEFESLKKEVRNFIEERISEEYVG